MSAGPARDLKPTVLMGGIALCLALLSWWVSRGLPEAPITSRPSDVLDAPTRIVDLRGYSGSTDTLRDVFSIADATQLDGDWLLLDSRSSTVTRIGPGSRPIWQAGRQGDGPGETELPRWMAVSDTIVAVLEASGERLVRYSIDGAVLEPVRLGGPDCGFGPAAGLAPGNDGAFYVLRSCVRLDMTQVAVVSRVGPEGRSTLSGEVALGSPTGPFRPFRAPVLGILLDVPYLGLLSDGCLRPLEPGSLGIEPPDVCLDIEATPMVHDTLRDQLERRGAALRERGITLIVPERMPPFTSARRGGTGLVLTVPVPDGGDALDVVLEDRTRVRILVDHAATTHVGATEVLLAGEALSGSTVRRVAWR